MPLNNLHIGADQCASLSGVLDFGTVLNVLHAGVAYVQAEAAPSFDFKEVTQADSAAVALMLSWWRAAQEEKKTIRFLNLPDSILALMKVSDLEKILG